MSDPVRSGLEVAIIGMAGRLPGAPDLDGFWRNLRSGHEAIRTWSREELREAGIAPARADHPSFVPSAAPLAAVDCFDAPLFGFTPREAAAMDPQHRIFLECCWEALEGAGYNPQRTGRKSGVYAGCGFSEYLLLHLVPDGAFRSSLGDLQTTLGNDKDYLAMRVAYRLDFEGPAVTVQTACSTSLVAVHLACQALRNGECDLALAGGVSLALGATYGYFWSRDGILSPDGRCRAFDEAAAGTVFGSGAGVVVLRRLDDALADGDPIRAVIRGSAVGNDGGGKVGFTAPVAEGQAATLRAALADAAVEPGSVGYIECHGTGTPLGDPIEVAALRLAYAPAARQSASCALGSLKSAVGHLNTASGVAGLIKTVLALEHRELPPTLHVERPNPELALAGSPFYLNTALAPWPRQGNPRRAGVSSFGMGGTNAHLVVEEAPEEEPTAPASRWQLLPLSARTPAALEELTDSLAAHLRQAAASSAHQEQGEECGSGVLADIAFTLQTGRRRFVRRRVLVASGPAEAAGLLTRRDGERLADRSEERSERPVAFLFPGQGEQWVGMGEDLYRGEPAYRQAIDRCADLLASHLGLDLRRLLHPADPPARAAAERALGETRYAQPAIFAVEYALALLWMDWGVRPAALVGHSLGELTAAAVAGVFPLPDALALVAARGRIMQEQPEGALLAVARGAAELLPALPRELSLAAVNGPESCVVAGPLAAVERLAEELAARGVRCKRLAGSCAFHSTLLDGAVAPFRAEVARAARGPAAIPFLSNVSGRWITAEEAADPGYWGRQLRQTVQFADCAAELFRHPEWALLEVGPGHTLASLLRRHPGRPEGQPILSSLPHKAGNGTGPGAAGEGDGPSAGESEQRRMAEALGRLWLAGVEPDWTGFHRHALRRRVRLPTYPFARESHWVGAPPGLGAFPPVLASEPATARQVPPAAAGAPPAAEALPGAEVVASPPVWTIRRGGGNRRPRLETAFRAPVGEREEMVAAVWRELFGFAEIGADDDFLELGGHSLLAAQVAARLEEELGAEVTVSALFAHPTVARLGRHLGASERRRGGLGELLLHPEARFEPFPLTEVQEAYWVGRSGAFALGNVGTHVYTEMEGEGLDLARFETACRRLIARHDMLRAVFLPDGRQQVLREVPVWQLAVADLAGATEESRAAELARLREEMSHQLLPGDRWPMFDLRASRLPGGRVRLHFSFDFLIADAWSIHLLNRELAWLYQHPDAELPPLALTFRDYVLAEAGLRALPAYEEALAYWRPRLADLPGGPDLPLVRDPAELVRPRFHRRSAGLAPAAWRALKAQAAAGGLTPSVCLVAAFAEVLGAWSRSPRFLITLTQFRRLPLHPEVDRVVGDFTSLTLLEVDPRGTSTLLERARRLQRRLLADLDHQLVGGIRVLREHSHASGGRGLAVPVVFTSLLGLESEAAGQGEESEAGAPGDGSVVGEDGRGDQPARPRFAEVFTVSQTPQVWLDHQAAERDGGLSLTWDAIDELFPAGLIDDLFSAYTALVERLAAGALLAGGDDSGLPLPDSHRWAREEANATTLLPLSPLLLQDLFFAAAAAAPEAPAVVAPDRTLSYRELRRRANALAVRLRALGARPETLVAVVMEKGWEQVVGALAVLEAGAAYLPIDPALPAERIRGLLEQGAVELAVTQRWIEPAVAWPAEVRPLVVEAGEPEGEPVPLPPLQGPENLAYTIFTSGSTGVPKGVMISHQAAVNTLLDINRRFAVGPRDRILALSSLSFDLSVYDVFGLLAAGGVVVLPAPAEHRNPARWRERMRAAGVTLWDSVPALLEMLVEETSGRGLALPAELRLALLSGDWIPMSLADRLRALAPGASVVSLGGATEAAIWSLLHPIGGIEPGWASVPYGRPTANQRFHVLGPDLSDRPEWVAGDLYIAGDGLSRGYWRDPVRTAVSFVPHPRTGERLYRTGDLARYRPGGVLEFLGREDSQVKVQGHRIELGEIETVLLAEPRVRAAAVAALGDRHRKRLVAYVVPAGEPPSDAELTAVLAARLPAYMVPPTFVRLEALPLGATGKVDRRALPAPAEAGTPVPQEASLGDPIAAQLAAIWCEVLGRPRIGLNDNFFTLGGDSILSIQIVARAQRAGLELSADQIFLHPTVGDLARVLSAFRGEGAPAPTARGVVGPVVGPVPLTPVQHWFFEHGFEVCQHWNQAVLLAPSQALSLSRLARAVAALFDHHDALRLRFARGPAGWRQFNAPPGPAPFAAIDLAALPAGRRAAALEGAAAALQGSLDLAAGPLGRIALFVGAQRLVPGAAAAADGSQRLLLLFHHLIVDGLSWRILLEDLAGAYAQLTAREAVRLPAAGASFRAWAERLSAHAWAGAHEEEIPFWLEGGRALWGPLPLDAPARARVDPASNTEASVATVRLAFGAGETAALLHEAPEALRAYVHEILLAALAFALGRWLGEGALVLDLETHGREGLFPDLDLSRTVGWFTGIHPLLLELAPEGRDLTALLAQVKRRLRSVPRGGVGYGILRYLNPRPEVAARLAVLPQAAVAFNYLGQFAEPAGLLPAPESTGPWNSPRLQRRHQLFVFAAVSGGEMRVGFAYSANLHRQSTIAALAEDYRRALEELLELARAGSAGAWTPADFPLVDLDQAELESALEAAEFEGV